MTKDIESLLRIISDLNRFEHGDCSIQKVPLSFIPGELTENELDLVAAASLEEHTSNLPNRKKEMK